MKAEDLAKLIDALKNALASHPPGAKVAVVGCTATAIDVVTFLASTTLPEVQRLGIYTPGKPTSALPLNAKTLDRLAEDKPDIVVIASDEGKEPLLEATVPFLQPSALVLISGFGHFAFRDATFDETTKNTLIPSFANGYPNSLIHIYQCLRNASRLGLEGIVAEFGMFKGGTTMLISRFIEEFGQHWKVFGFDTFDGFPPRRSPLDMYAHPDCVFLDEKLVRRCFEGRNVEIVAGDVVETVELLRDQKIVLAFVDTDNYTSASKIINVIAARVVIGGAIVFDHFTGRDRHLNTIGERIAAKRLLDDPSYFNLHDTGVFLRVQ